MYLHVVLQSGGDAWQRQRRLIAPNLNERISALVWTESCTQAAEMLEHITDTVTDQTIDGLRMIAINVLGHAGYGTPRSWKQHEVQATESLGKLTYIQAVSTVV